MPKPQTTNDAHLWAEMIISLRAAGHFAGAERLARTLVAAVRRERDPQLKTWAPGDTIPCDVISVYDLDGDIWVRQTRPHSTMRDAWKMRDRTPEQHESRAGGVHLTPGLLDEYGPLTQVVSGRPPRQEPAAASAGLAALREKWAALQRADAYTRETGDGASSNIASIRHDLRARLLADLDRALGSSVSEVTAAASARVTP